MVDPESDQKELLRLAQEISSASRRALLSTVADLFGERPEVLTERERALMSDILGKLLREVETAVRRDLAAQLAERSDAPQELLLHLANEETELVRPALMKTEVLKDPELIEIVVHRTLQHQLAVAMRRMASAEVADGLLEANGTDVIKALLEDPNPKVSEATMDYLVEESRRVDSYQEPLVKRESLNPELARRLNLWVAAALRSHLLERFEVDPVMLDDLLLAVMRHLGPDAVPSDAPGGQRRGAAEALAAQLDAETQITPQSLIHMLRDGEVSLFEAVLGRMTGLERPRLQRVVYEPGGRSLAIVCRATGIEKPVFASLFLLSRKGRPSEKVSDPQEVAQVMALFDRIDPDAAQRVVRLWQRDWAYQDAIDQV
ncbi:MAG: DUF2336 domain-containing protein [Kiloniellales bacterium]|nr:DUF2336 domain-containing protein [Kiloniellales bacterium]